MEVAKSSSQLSSASLSVSYTILTGDDAWNLQGFSGDRKDSAALLGFANDSGPLIGVVSPLICCPVCTLRSGGSRLGGIGLAAFDRIDARKDPPVGDLKASFHCLTSSTASLKFAGCLTTGASVRLDPTIHACFKSFFAETLRFGSFWKHCIKKSRAA